MKAMDWKCGAGVACLLMTLTAAESRAQAPKNIKEPAGIPVVRGQSMQALGSPFSPEYQGAWYQSQANRVAMIAWMEHNEMQRQAYLAEMAKRTAAEDAAKTKPVPVPARVVASTPSGPFSNFKWTWGSNGCGGNNGAPPMMVSSTPVPNSTATIVVDSSSATPFKSDKQMPAVAMNGKNKPEEKVISSRVISETIYEIKPDGSMVQITPAPTATVKAVPAQMPQTIASEPSKSAPAR